MGLVFRALAIVFLTSFFTTAQADYSLQLLKQLEEAKSSDEAFRDFMERLPVKYDGYGQAVEPGSTFFTEEQLQSGRVVEAKDSTRVQLFPQNLEGRAGEKANDNARDLTDNGRSANFLTTLQAMEAAGLKSASLAETPWSDSYWPIYQGVLGARMGAKGFPSNSDWAANLEWVILNPLGNLFAAAGARSISPSEKYDMLIGAEMELSTVNGQSVFGTLTGKMWKEGEGYYNNSGKVEAWMGICHGWAPAAFMLPRPKKAVELKTAAGEMVKFYPDDIKALGSLLWAKNSYPTRFIGGRCNDKDPAKDANGRVLSQDCFDTNPGAWHKSIVNQIGVSQRSFVMDATYDYEVWNQPIYSYKYSYFNPETNKARKKLRKAIIPLGEFKSDRFKKYRDAKTVSIVGVSMTVEYIVENWPAYNDTDSAENDAVRSVTYLYDLELDAQGNIIGGEWYSNKHPDFLWLPEPRPLDPAKKLGRRVIKRARKEAAKGSPFAPLVEFLFTKAAE